MNTMSVRLCLVVALLTTTLGPLTAIERKPLPPFSVVARDGTETSSDELTTEGKWLLVYVQPGCTPCDGVLRSIDTADAHIAERLTVVVGGANAADAARLAAGYPKLAASRWFADPERSMGKALPVAGMPVVFGLRGRMLEWSRAGLTPSIASVKSAMTSWTAIR